MPGAREDFIFRQSKRNKNVNKQNKLAGGIGEGKQNQGWDPAMTAVGRKARCARLAANFMTAAVREVRGWTPGARILKPAGLQPFEDRVSA